MPRTKKKASILFASSICEWKDSSNNQLGALGTQLLYTAKKFHLVGNVLFNLGFQISISKFLSFKTALFFSQNFCLKSNNSKIVLLLNRRHFRFLRAKLEFLDRVFNDSLSTKDEQRFVYLGFTHPRKKNINRRLWISECPKSIFSKISKTFLFSWDSSSEEALT